MADEQMSQFTDGSTPALTDYIVGYDGDEAGQAGGNRRWSYQNVLNLYLATASTWSALQTYGAGVLISNGQAIKTSTTTAHTMIFQAYDVDGAAYKTFMTFTNGNTPSLTISAPSGGSLTISGGVISGANGSSFAGTTSFGSNGASGAANYYPPTSSSGYLQVAGSDNASGNFNTVVTNEGSGQDTVYTIPASPVASLKFLTTAYAGTQVITNGELALQDGMLYFQNANTITAKKGANKKAEIFTLNGATPVSISNTSITADSMIMYGLKTPGGTVGNLPRTQTITASTGFTVAGDALDTSDYFYWVIETN